MSLKQQADNFLLVRRAIGAIADEARAELGEPKQEPAPVVQFWDLDEWEQDEQEKQESEAA